MTGTKELHVFEFAVVDLKKTSWAALEIVLLNISACIIMC